MAEGLHKFTVQEANNAKLGQAGYKIVAGGNTGAIVDGVEYVAVTGLDADTTLTTTSNNTDQYPNWAGQIIGQSTVYGRWTQVTIGGTGGTAAVYRG
tara:strand:+ start:916 stop:1206 length:291 start_codon:yes stop_codon:yes gene_type:complete